VTSRRHRRGGRSLRRGSPEQSRLCIRSATVPTNSASTPSAISGRPRHPVRPSPHPARPPPRSRHRRNLYLEKPCATGGRPGSRTVRRVMPRGVGGGLPDPVLCPGTSHGPAGSLMERHGRTGARVLLGQAPGPSALGWPPPGAGGGPLLRAALRHDELRAVVGGGTRAYAAGGGVDLSSYFVTCILREGGVAPPTHIHIIHILHILMFSRAALVNSLSQRAHEGFRRHGLLRASRAADCFFGSVVGR